MLSILGRGLDRQGSTMPVVVIGGERQHRDCAVAVELFLVQRSSQKRE